MNTQDIYDFFFKASNDQKRFEGLNFLCEETNVSLINAAFSEQFIKWLGKSDNNIEKIIGLREFYQFQASQKTKNTPEDKDKLFKDYIGQLNKVIKSCAGNLINEWTSLVEKNHGEYKAYLERLFCTNREIKYVIISEAPLLTLKKNEDDKLMFDCKYIFSTSHPNVGNYRKVPYQAICEIENIPINTENPTSEQLINLLIETGVLFLDLIPLPLPQIESELRKKWSIDSNYFIDSEPRVITFLRCSLQYIFHLNPTVNFINDVQISLMMPSNSALGIINYYLNYDTESNSEPFLGKIEHIKNKITRMNTEVDAKKLSGFSLRLHRQVAIGSQGGPEKDLLKHALSN